VNLFFTVYDIEASGSYSKLAGGFEFALTLIDDICHDLAQERQRKVDDGDGAGEDGQASTGNISWQFPLLSWSRSETIKINYLYKLMATNNKI
jgi:hypothetical protein